MRKQLRGSLLLLFTALIWGTAFVAQSEGMNYVEPFTYNAVRTLIGGLVLLPVIAAFRSSKRADSSEAKPYSKRDTVTGGMICGCVLFVASSFQQSGISMTTAGKAGFITALYIIIVPLIQLLTGKKCSAAVWISVVIAALGFWLLCMNEGLSLGRGDALVLCCAVFFALHILVIDHFNARGADGMVMSCIQFFTAGILMLASMFLFESPDIECILDAKYTILYTGIMSSGVAYTLQIIGQKEVEPATATLIMSLESVFAALSGWLVLHEALSGKELCGCALVFAAVLLAQKRQPNEKNQSKGMVKINEEISE